MEAITSVFLSDKKLRKTQNINRDYGITNNIDLVSNIELLTGHITKHSCKCYFDSIIYETEDIRTNILNFTWQREEYTPPPLPKKEYTQYEDGEQVPASYNDIYRAKAWNELGTCSFRRI